MANIYFNAAVDTSWDNPLNWWNDALFTDPALSIPADGDTVYLAAEMQCGPSVPVTLNYIYVADASTGGGSFGVNFTGASGDATFYDYSNLTGGVINATFYDSSTLSGSVENATFYDYSYATGSSILTGNVTFNNNSRITGGGQSSSTASLTFNDSSSSDAFNNALFGVVVFNDSSYNAGDVFQVATFNNNSYNVSGTLGGGIFNDDSLNTGAVGGATFNNNSGNSGGTVTYNGIFNDSSFNTGIVGYAIFNGLYVGARVGGSYGAITLNMTCPQSGGGNGLNLAQLIGLPNFIKI